MIVPGPSPQVALAKDKQKISNTEAAETRRVVDNLLNQLSTGEEYLDLLEYLIANRECCVDKEFPPKELSLYPPDLKKKYPFLQNLVWKRPKQIFPAPELFPFPPTPLDLRQGDLGNCYFLGCLSALLDASPEFITRLFVFPYENSRTKAYNDWLKYGAFCTRLCITGRWQEIITDDYFPCSKPDSFPAFTRGMNQELWMMVLEKSYAKIYKNYSNIENGKVNDCLSDLTGAPVESLGRGYEGLWGKVVEGGKEGWVMCCCCGFEVRDEELVVEMGELGLEEDRPYTLMGAFEWGGDGDGGEGGGRMVILRWPWGQAEWKGDFGVGSERLSEGFLGHVGSLLGEGSMAQFAEQGIFFMGFEDFLKFFSDVQICRASLENKLSSIEFQSKHHEDRYYRFSIKTKGHYYISAHQIPVKISGASEYSWVSMLLGKVLENNKIEYIRGVFKKERDVWMDSTLELTEGTYLVYIRHNFPYHPPTPPTPPPQETPKPLTLSVYGPKSVFLKALRPEKCSSF
jgi:calpain-15